MKTIILFTDSYPYSIAIEDSFIEPELEVLNKYFKVILVPLTKQGRRSKFVDKLDNVYVYEKFENFSLKKEIINTLKVNSLFIEELFKCKSLSHLRNLIAHFVRSKWIEKIIEQNLKSDLWSKNSIFYTYWFNYATSALIRLKNTYSIKVITRTHRGDLYIERKKNRYIPFRHYDVKHIDKIITISMQGYNYLKEKYSINNIENYYLGIKDLQIENPLNHDTKILKIISCSLMVEVKRIDLIMQYLSSFSKEKQFKIEWFHIGNGKLESYLEEKRRQLKHKYFNINFVGYLENKEIYKFYEKNSFDYFVTLSGSEGLPVSLMEACSVGLPIIATDVGGINEIVKNGINGFLLSENPNYEEFKKNLEKALKIKQDYSQYLKFREESRNIYMTKFNATINHDKFAKFLKRL